MKKLIIIDHANIQFKSIFAFRNNSTCPMPYLYLIQILGYLKKLGTTLDDTVIVGIDFGSWRKEIDPNYKAQRKALREEKEDADFWNEMFKEANELVERLKTCMPWHFIKIYKAEFDDIASCAVRFLDDYDEKIIISTDEDLQQLCIVPNVRIFSPYTKKFKIVKNPEAILLKKIKGDKSDNLLDVPKTEEEFEKRKMIVDLLHLPGYIEKPITEILLNLTPKNLYINKVPFYSCRKRVKALYNV